MSTPFCFKCTNCASACKRCDEARPCLRCQKYGLTDSCVDGVRKARKVGVKRGPYKRKSKVPAPEAAPYPGQLTPAQTLCHFSHFLLGFPPTGEGPWVAPSDQPDGAPPGATPAIAAQYMPPEGYWSYPYYPPPHGYAPPPPDGHANGDSASHGQPPHHPAYYPMHPGYPPVPMYPPPPGAYGPIPTPSGQTPATEQTASNQGAAPDDERAATERPKKKKRAGGEEGVTKSSKKSKRVTNSTNEAPAPVVANAPAPVSADSPDDHGSPVAHNGSGVGGEPLPHVIAAV
jgi:neural Wiskott-Aldrich syndrome protein